MNQQNLSSFIWSVADPLAEAERAIELLQERRTALIAAAVTGKIDVREFTPQEAS